MIRAGKIMLKHFSPFRFFIMESNTDYKEKILIRLLGELQNGHTLGERMREFILPRPKLQRHFITIVRTIYVPLSRWSQGTVSQLQLIFIAHSGYETSKKLSEIKLAFKCWEALTLYWEMALANTTFSSSSLEHGFQLWCHFAPWGAFSDLLTPLSDRDLSIDLFGHPMFFSAVAIICNYS